MIDPLEKRQAFEEAHAASMLLAKHLQDVPIQSFYKALRNYVQKTTPSKSHFQAINARPTWPLEENLSVEEMRERLEAVFVYMVQVGTDETTEERAYKTSELATFFGVTVATIHNWLNAGRFLGVEKPARFKHIRISENTLYLSPSGERIPLWEIVNMYEEEQQKTTIRTLSKAEELKEIVDTLVFYEKKYGGDFASTLGRKDELSSLEKRDAHEWKYLMKLLEELV